jgi:hypothetical protein
MRKTFVTAFVALLAILALASCDNIPTGQSEDGFVTLKVNTGVSTGSSRSIDDDIAKAEKNYVEVIFRRNIADPGDPVNYKYYRAGTYWGLDFTIKLPVDTSYLISDAILLIGKENNDGTYTLLATGVLAGATATVPFDVEATTTEIEFTATSLNIILNAGATTPSFSINETNDVIVDKGFANKTKNGLIGANKFFQVPTEASGTDAINAELTLGINAATGANIMVVSGAALPTPITTPVLFYKQQFGPPITATGITPASNSNLSGGKIGFNFETSDEEGIYFITIRLPVRGFNTTVPEGITWIIRGGTKSGFDHTGDENDNIMLLVKDEVTTYATVGITTPSWQ